jgi:pimeloyl-[acyl-carrier protein] methyl ester esterase
MAEVLILPGLDGTGTLHDEFASELSRFGIGCRTISYPTSESLGYSQLAKFVRPQLPTDRPFVLLGESFSGPVAILIAASHPTGLVGLVLSTTFARAPASFLGWLAGLTRFAPVNPPSSLISWSLLGRWSSPSLVQKVRAAIATVQPRVLRARTAEAMRVDVLGALAGIATPALVLRAKSDRVLLLSNQVELSRHLPNATQQDLEGPHLLLQTQPKACAEAVARFIRGVGV